MTQEQRQHTLAVLSKSKYQDIVTLWQTMNIHVDYHCLKKPEVGMVMVKAQAGGAGQPFNMGEMTVTRTVVRLDPDLQGNQPLGFGYTAGRDVKKSELIAVIDACCQHAQYAQNIQEHLVTPLFDQLNTQHQQHEQTVDRTKVNFFTMVRGE